MKMDSPLQPSDWTRILAAYRQPKLSRSLFELAVTLVPLLALWALAWWMVSVSTALAVALSLLNAAFLVRTFMIQHDCGHGSFFKNRTLNDWLGRGLGILTLTPYDVWRRNHATHHASTGNLERRGTGDIPTLTVREYREKSPLGRFLYRLLRNPFFLFGVVPFYAFVLQNRLPLGQMRAGWRPWVSALVTDAAIIAIIGMILWLGGWKVLVFAFLPTILLSASAGMWLFFVQHQFEHTSWDHEENWNVQAAALNGSSHYALPGILRWVTANIGVHHVHHLAARIPFYRLDEVMRDYDVLAQSQRLTIRDSLHCARLHLWCEKNRRLLSFAEARALSA